MTKRFLIVDSDDATAETFQRLLGAADVSVATARTQAEAESKLWKGAYDVVVTDLHLGNQATFAGLNVALLAKQMAAATEVILLAGQAGPEVLQKVQQLGVAYYFEKPLPDAALWAALASLGVDFSDIA
ncbi:MAG TPA: response regulator [Candidatus Edwardsbacteria bacterium]|nr:response regulator [Candidatus Edwardsbacteria bacterium]